MSSAAIEPSNVEAEEHVLGALFLSDPAVDVVSELLEPAHFYRDSHRTIYTAILALRQRGDPIEPLIVAAELERLGVLANVGGQSRLVELVSLTPTASNVAHYAALVLESARSRNVYRAALALEKASLNGGLALHPEMIDEAVRTLEEARVLPGEPGVPEGPVFLDSEDFVGSQFAPPEALLGTDDLPILAVGSFNLFVGRPGVGKTTCLIDLMCHLAAGLPWPTADADERAPKPWPCSRPLNIAFIENEGPQESFRAKLAAKLEHFPHEIEGRIIVQSLRWGVFSFADRALMSRVRGELDENEIDLVMGDPLASLGLEGVGSPAETLAFMQLLRPLGLGTTRAFLFLHHFRERAEKDEDELSRISGAWGPHIDTQLTLASTHSEDQLRLAYPKIRWARVPYPKPAILGKVYNSQGFCALSEEGDVSLLEPLLAGALEVAREAGRVTDAKGEKSKSEKVAGWLRSEELAKTLEKRPAEVRKALEGARHIFRDVTEDAVKMMGVDSGRTRLWGLIDWPEGRGVENSSQASLADMNATDDGIPF